MLLAALKCNAIKYKTEDSFPSLKFVINVAGFLPRAENFQTLFQNQLDIPSLHVIGELDSAPIDGPMKAFKNSKLVSHPGGHVVPKTEDAIKEIMEFIHANIK